MGSFFRSVVDLGRSWRRRAAAHAVLAVLAAWPGLARAAVTPDEQGDTVMLITWRGCEESCRGFQEELKQRGVVTRILLRDAGQDHARIPALVEEARQLRPKVVVTWGDDVTLGVVGPVDAVDPARHLTDIPVVYMYVAEPVKSRIARADDATGRINVAGTDYSVPLATKLRAMNDYRRLSRLGMLYDETQKSSVERKDAMASVAGTNGISFVARPLPLTPDGRPDPARIDEAVAQLGRDGVDWIYFGFSSFLIEHAEEFTASAMRRGIPLFSGGERPVRLAHGLFALTPALGQIGALAALQVERILAKPDQPPGSLPTARMPRFRMLVNMRVASDLGLFPPIEMFRVLEVVR